MIRSACKLGGRARGARHVDIRSLGDFAVLVAVLSLGVAPRAALGQTPGNPVFRRAEPAAQAPAAGPSPLDGVVFGVGLRRIRAVERQQSGRARQPAARQRCAEQQFLVEPGRSHPGARTTDVAAGVAGTEGRLDLMFGQNTETMQGGAQNEPRPQVYRNIFQAYGTYVFPVGSGLTVGFRQVLQCARLLRITMPTMKSTIPDPSLSTILPFYHMGVRTTYEINKKLTAQYWLVNGANQTEDFNGFKSNAFLLTVKPTKTISWNLNYYLGTENRTLTPAYNPGVPRPADTAGSFG